MNFYHEWEARFRHEEILRETRRKDGWRLENGRLMPARSLWEMVAQLFGGRPQEEQSKMGTVTPLPDVQDKKKDITRKAS